MDSHARVTAEELLANSAWMRKVALELVRDSARADDLVQQTVTRWLRHGGLPGGALRPWLTEVMRNLARSTWRSEARREQRERAVARSEAEEAEDIAATLEMYDLLSAAIKELSFEVRTVVVRHYLQQETLASIARSSKLPESTVRNRLKRGLDELRVKLDSRFGDRDSWVGLFVSFVARTKPSAAVPAAASVASVFVWVAASIALLVAGTMFGARLWSEQRAARESALVDAETALAARRATSSAPSTTPEPRIASTASARSPVVDARTIDSRAPVSNAAFTAVDVRVLDKVRQQPIEGAKIALEADPSELADPPSVVTDHNGHAQLKLPEHHIATVVGAPIDQAKTATITLHISARGHADRTQQVRVEMGATIPIADVMLEPGGTVHGSVATSDGSSLPKLYVGLTDDPEITDKSERTVTSAPLATALVRSDGTYEMTGAPIGVHRIVAINMPESWRMLRTAPVDVRANETTEAATLVIKRAALTISGIVFQSDGELASYAPINYIESRRADVPIDHRRITQTNERGSFVIPLEGPEAVDLYVAAAGDTSGDVVMRDVAAGSDGLEIRLPKPTWIELAVTDEHGAPLASFTTSYRWESDATLSTSNNMLIHASTTVYGVVETRALVRALPFFVVVQADGRTRAEFGPYTRENHPPRLTIALNPLGTIGGSVTFQGNPVANAVVEVRELLKPEPDVELSDACNGFPCHVWIDPNNGTKTTDRHGAFVVMRRERGTYVLIVRAHNLASFESEPFEHDPEKGSSRVIELGSGGALVGRVIASPGKPTQGILVGISRGDGDEQVVPVGADGSYHFEHLTPGKWWIRKCEHVFRADRGVARDETHETFSGFDPTLSEFEVIDGATKTLDLDLAEARCKLNVRVVLPPCEGCTPSATLAALPPNPPSKPQNMSLANDGSYEVEPRRLGNHQLVIHMRSPDALRDQTYRWTIRGVKRGDNQRELEFTWGVLTGDAPPNSTITHEWKGHDVVCKTSFQADAQGHFRFDGIPAGSGSLTVAHAGVASIEYPVELRAGETLTLTLE